MKIPALVLFVTPQPALQNHPRATLRKPISEFLYSKITKFAQKQTGITDFNDASFFHIVLVILDLEQALSFKSTADGVAAIAQGNGRCWGGREIWGEGRREDRTQCQRQLIIMAITFKSTSLLQLKKPEINFRVCFPSNKPIVSVRRYTQMAAISTESVGLSETFAKLKKQGKVALIPYITAGDPDLSTTAEALKVLDSCGSDIIELGVPYSDPLADGPVIQAAATRSLAKGTNLDAIISMLKEVVPQLSCPIALFTYYNPILKRGTGGFMSTIRDIGLHGLVVPDVPLEETETLRLEAKKNGIELVLLTTPTTPTNRMKAIVDASEGFVYLVSSVGVTGARASVSNKVQALLQEIKEETTKPVAVGFGISKPEHVKHVVGWGANGVIVGSAMVKLLGEAKSPQDGLKELEIFTNSLKSALPCKQA